MPGLDYIDLQDAIVAKVRTILPNDRVFEDTIPDEDAPPRNEDGTLIPYIVLRFGPMKRVRGGGALSGPRHDEYFGTVDIINVTSLGRLSRRKNIRLVNALIGFKPDGVSPMTLRGEEADPSQFVVASNEARPTQNVASTRMRYTINAGPIGDVTD